MRDIVVRALASRGPSYGMEIAAWIRANGRWWHRLAMALHHLYWVLYRLEDEGLVMSEPRPGVVPEYPRRFYRLTAKGHAAAEKR